MQSIMLSVQPQWIEKILNKEKTIEIRKTMPKCNLPCKAYIYCTKSSPFLLFNKRTKIWELSTSCELEQYAKNGKVIAEFTLNEVDEYELELQDDNTYESIGKVYYDDETNEREINIIESSPDIETTDFIKQSKVSIKHLRKYLGKGFQPCYAWHIDDLKIYDKPKNLNEFKKQNKCFQQGDVDNLGCYECGCALQEVGECDGRCSVVEKPPQGWFYIEELEEE